MKTWLFVVFTVLAGSALAAFQEAYSLMLVFDGEHVIEPDQVVSGDLGLVDGEVLLQPGSRLAGSAYMLGGRLVVEGEIQEHIYLVGGTLVLRPGARVGGNLNVGGGTVERSPEATVAGDVTGGTGLQLPDVAGATQQSPQQRLFSSLAPAILLPILALLAVRFVPRPVIRVSEAVAEHPIVSGAMGILVVIVVPALLVLMAFTIILIPVTILLLVVAILAVAYGLIGLGVATGRLLIHGLKFRLSPPRTAALGTFVFMLALILLSFIPAVGGLITMLITIVGIGAVVLTRFGLEEFLSAEEEMNEEPQ